ncbi:hypothetical protein [Emticicia sp. 17c]|uniref:hypothetical protein n=1 Tax=Emticicia sp. 17c TaxID=3127704 RepID=UPI00301BE44D
MKDNKIFFSVSVLGGSAFFIRSMEECIKYYQLDYKEWQFILSRLWKVVDCRNYDSLSQWDELDGEIVPSVIMENIPYEKKELQATSEDEHDLLKKLYLKTPRLILDIINELFTMASSIIGSDFDQFSLWMVERINKLTHKLEVENIPIPETSILERSKIKDNNGLGCTLDKYEISQLLIK